MHSSNSSQIQPVDFHDIKKWFCRYTKQYVTKTNREYDDIIVFKYAHSWRVMRIAQQICAYERFSPEINHAVQIASFLHDVGRYEQFKCYKTFIDSISRDHAELGISVLQEHRVLEKGYGHLLDSIYFAIANHNKFALSQHTSEFHTVVAKVIRDADKLDIFQVMSTIYAVKSKKRNRNVELDLPDTPEFSTQICDQLKNGQLASSKSMKTLNDFKLLKLGWVYDINFAYSFKTIFEKKYLDSIAHSLPHVPLIHSIYEQVTTFLMNKCHSSMPQEN